MSEMRADEEVFKRFKGVKLYEIIDIVSLEHGARMGLSTIASVLRVSLASGEK